MPLDFLQASRILHDRGLKPADEYKVNEVPGFESGKFDMESDNNEVMMSAFFKGLGQRAFDEETLEGGGLRRELEKILALAVDCYLIIQDEQLARRFLKVVAYQMENFWVSCDNKPTFSTAHRDESGVFGAEIMRSSSLARESFYIDFIMELRKRENHVGSAVADARGEVAGEVSSHVEV